MTDPPSPSDAAPAAAKIPPAGRGQQPLWRPSREQLDPSRLRFVRRGRRLKADLSILADEHGAPLLIKDVAAKRWYLRWIGRLEMARETRAYRRLGATRGVPRFAGRIDRDAVAIEWIEGTQLARLPDRLARGPVYVERLRRIMERLHAKGLAHLDLRSNKNVVVRADGELFVVDFASAVWLRPGSRLHRWCFGQLTAHDVTGWLKWKKVLAAGPLTDDELELLGRHGRWRRFWPFNPKHRAELRRRRALRRSRFAGPAGASDTR